MMRAVLQDDQTLVSLSQRMKCNLCVCSDRGGAVCKTTSHPQGKPGLKPGGKSRKKRQAVTQAYWREHEAVPGWVLCDGQRPQRHAHWLRKPYTTFRAPEMRYGRGSPRAEDGPSSQRKRRYDPRVTSAHEQKSSSLCICAYLVLPNALAGRTHSRTTCLPPERTEFNPRPGHFRIFACGNRGRTLPLVGGFSRGSSVSPAFAIRRYSILTLLHPHRLSQHRYSPSYMVRGKRQIPEKTHRPVASSDTIPVCENSGVTRAEIEPGSPIPYQRITDVQDRSNLSFIGPIRHHNGFSQRRAREHYEVCADVECSHKCRTTMSVGPQDIVLLVRSVPDNTLSLLRMSGWSHILGHGRTLLPRAACFVHQLGTHSRLVKVTAAQQTHKWMPSSGHTVPQLNVQMARRCLQYFVGERALAELQSESRETDPSHKMCGVFLNTRIQDRVSKACIMGEDCRPSLFSMALVGDTSCSGRPHTAAPHCILPPMRRSLHRPAGPDDTSPPQSSPQTNEDMIFIDLIDAVYIPTSTHDSCSQQPSPATWHAASKDRTVQLIHAVYIPTSTHDSCSQQPSPATWHTASKDRTVQLIDAVYIPTSTHDSCSRQTSPATWHATSKERTVQLIHAVYIPTSTHDSCSQQSLPATWHAASKAPTVQLIHAVYIPTSTHDSCSRQP
ncbi:hypothetical protein PR048_028412 [Dryococelus australis]|uniref:Uncharacterized protein n=1 Tax=Dryococelus australis TaxID=614101 RepID=A0ABQ9GAH3_9NEOP|nr:hypothetical protein PR048_028412 [Dryococelus australis]